MTVHWELLVEDLSMERALQAVLPRIAPGIDFGIHPHQSKSDLLEKLPNRLRGYKHWLPEDWRIAVLIDRDDDDCRKLKKRLEVAARNAGFRTRATSGSRAWQVVTRLAIEELEAWYFGDWEAVRAAYPRVPATIPSQASYRDPDAVKGGTWEALERILKNAGYFSGGLRKLEAAAAIGEQIQPARNRSRSFRAFAKVVADASPR